MDIRPAAFHFARGDWGEGRASLAPAAGGRKNALSRVLSFQRLAFTVFLRRRSESQKEATALSFFFHLPCCLAKDA
jgi:hypothetical protein